MQAEIALNVQQSIRPGECVDTVYYGMENSLKQCHATVVDNRFFVGLQSLGSGSSSTVTFNPNEGVAEVILTMTIAAPATGVGLAAPAGWGYALLRRVGYRYGSSQLYYHSGLQNFIQTMSMCEDSGKKQALVYAGGQALLTPSDWADVTKRTASIYLRLPHSSPAVSGGALPFPSDTLTAPLQFQIDMQDFNRVFSSVVGGDALPTTLSGAQVNFTQTTMQDAGDLIARRFDMSRHALTIPLVEGWCQEQVSFPITTGSDGSFSVSLTGAKAGDLKKLRVMVQDPLDQVPNGLNNPLLCYPPSSIQFAINGLIYLASNGASYLVNNILRHRTPPSVTVSDLAYNAGNYSASPVASSWVEIDLAQPYVLGNTGETALIHGVPVMNSVLSLSGTMPIGSKQYIVIAEYVLNCSWMASRGSAEFVF